jgi:hypothetical protein
MVPPPPDPLPSRRGDTVMDRPVLGSTATLDGSPHVRTDPPGEGTGAGGRATLRPPPNSQSRKPPDWA